MYIEYAWWQTGRIFSRHAVWRPLVTSAALLVPSGSVSDRLRLLVNFVVFLSYFVVFGLINFAKKDTCFEIVHVRWRLISNRLCVSVNKLGLRCAVDVLWAELERTTLSGAPEELVIAFNNQNWQMDKMNVCIFFSCLLIYINRQNVFYMI